MKKTYEKPRIYMERLELAEHVALNCVTIISHASYVTCSDSQTGEFAAESVCAVITEEYCVTNGEIDLGTFSS